MIIMSFAIIGFGDSLFMILIGAAVAAIGFGGSFPTIQTMCLLSVSPIRYGVASNTIYFGIDFGYFLGPVIAGIIINHYGLLNSFIFADGHALTFSPLYLSMIVPLLFALTIFIFGFDGYKRNAMKARGEPD